MKRIATLLGVALLAIVGVVVSASADSQTLDFESYTLGSVNGQDGWSSTNPNLDHEIADPVVEFGIAGFGSRALRISNAVATTSFGDHTFSQSLANEAGETAAQNGGKSGGTRQSHFEAEWQFISTTPLAEQPGLSVVASPDRGDGARMSWVQMTDTAGGIDINFNDYQSGAAQVGCGPGSNFVLSPVVTDLDRTIPHTIKLVMDFYDGPNNDVVNVYVDGALEHTGTSWEGYFNECESNPTRTVDSILFRTSVAAAGTLGKGFLIDGFSTTSAATTADDIYVRTDGSDTVCGGTANVAVGAFTGANQPCAVKTLTQALLLVSAGGNIHVEDGTYVTGAAVVITKDVTIDGNDGTRPVFKPGFDTVAGGHDTDAAAWFLTKPGNTVNLSDLEFDGTGNKIYAGIRFYGDASVDNVSVHHVGYAPTSPYLGIGIQVRPLADVDVADSEFANIGRIGIHYRGPDATGAITNNTFTGKGDGNGLDYAIEAGSGAVLDITGNTISDNSGVASDGSTSAGILATTFFGQGTSATLTSNTFLNNTTAVAVGYNGADTSTVIAHYNRMAGNDTGITTTAPNVNAENNWWGCNEGPGATGCDPVENGGTGVIDFGPWLVLSVGAPDNINAAAQIAADLNHNSSGIDTSGDGTLPDGAKVTITSLNPNRATTSPTSVPLAGGEVTSTITPAANDGLVAIPVKFDNATIAPIVRVDRVVPTRTITVPDFATSTTLAITLGGSDGGASGINGYCVSESDDAPAANDACFVYPKPASFTLSTGDGTKTLYAWTRDRAGNVSSTPAHVSDSTVLDTVAPTRTLSIPASTTSLVVPVTITASGASGYYLSESNTVPSLGDFVSVAPNTFTLSSGDGTKTVYLWVRDAAGNISTGIVSDTTNLDSDTTAPSVSIELPASTTTQSISIDVDGSGDFVAFLVKESGTAPLANDVNWVATAPSTFTVSAGNGVKTVFAWTKDAAGNVSASDSDTTDLEPLTESTVSITLPQTTNSRDVAVDVTALGAPAAYLVSENSTVPAANDPRWQPSLPSTFRLSSGDGTKTVYAWSKSTGGVVSSTANVTTLLDTMAPSAAVTTKAFVRTQRVPLKITGTDAGSGINGYIVSSKVGQPSAGAAGWLTTAPTSAAVAGPDGQKTIYVWTRDAAGNVSSTASVSVLLDTTKPTSRILFPANGSKITKLPFISGVAFDRSPGSGVLRTLVSIRREVGNTCSFWNGAEWVKKGCNARVWMRFPSGENWQVKRGFGRPNFLVEGNYSIFTRAGDRAANVSPASTFVLGVNWVRFQVVAP